MMEGSDCTVMVGGATIAHWLWLLFPVRVHLENSSTVDIVNVYQSK